MHVQIVDAFVAKNSIGKAGKLPCMNDIYIFGNASRGTAA